MKSAVQVRNALTRYTLTPLADVVTLHCTTTPDQGLHLGGLCTSRRAQETGHRAPFATVTLAQYLDTAPRCTECDKDLDGALRLSNPGQALRQLVRAYQVLAWAERTAQRPTLSIDQLVDLDKEITSKVGDARRTNAFGAGALAHLDLAAARTADALQRARTVHLGPLLAEVRAALIPTAHHDHVTWDQTPTLIGIAGYSWLTDRPRVIAAALALPGPDKAPLLRGPAYLVDYMHKAVGFNVYGFITTTPAHSPERDELIARLWDPDTTGPMAHLPHVATAAAAIACDAP